jgi:hypothetical protein
MARNTGTKSAFCGGIAALLPCIAALVGCEPSSAPPSGAPLTTATPPGFDASAGAPVIPTLPEAGAPAPTTDKAWGPAVEISNGAYIELRGSPQVGIDAAGNATAVWLEALADHTRNAVWASHFSAAGAWSAPATIDNAVGSSSAPQLAITPSGTALVAFAQSESNQGGGQLLVTNRFTGAWGTPTTASMPGQAPTKPFVALGDDGAAAVVFTASDGVFPRAWAACSSVTGAWDAPMLMKSTAQPGWAPSVTVSTNGDVVMTWTETEGAFSDTSIWASRNQGGVWSAPSRISSDVGAVLGSILVGADASGDVLAVWSQRIAGLYTLRSARMTASSGAWSAPVTVNDGTREAIAPHLGVDAAGDAAAVWFETNHGVVASRFTSATSTWGRPVVIQARAAGVVWAPVPDVGIDAKGNAVATWVQAVGSPPRPHLFAAHSAPSDGAWTAPIDLIADPSATPFADEAQLSVNANGDAVVVWHQDAGTAAAPGIWARLYR